MSFNEYFQDELAYLTDLGGEFVKENPKLEPFLSPTDPDPDVRRLMEGFAFLTGRLRQKLDDEFPELTHSLLRVLWPHYLRPVPCMSILEFTPIAAALTETKTIKAGLDKGRLVKGGVQVEGRPLEEPPVRCRFRTCYDVVIAPITLSTVEYSHAGSGGVLKLVITPLPGVAFERAKIEQLRLYLHSERESAVGTVLYLWLRHYLEDIKITAVLGDGNEKVFTHDRHLLQPVGFRDEEALLPYPDNAFSGYRLLQEYFSLPEKFHFLDLTGLEFLRETPWIEQLVICFRFRKPLDNHLRVRPEHVRLHCTPIVNLFAHDGDQVPLRHRHSEYRVRPHSDQPRFYELYSVDSVTGAVQGSGKSRTFVEFESFAHAQASKPRDEGYEPAGCYRLRLRPSVVGRGVETYISFVNTLGAANTPEQETISLELTCTNRDLPEQLRVGQIDRPGDGCPEFVTFRNIARVSPSLTPLLDVRDGPGPGVDDEAAGRGRGRRAVDAGRDARLHWRLISNMALNHYSLGNVSALRAILETYDFRANRDAQARKESALRMKGIEAVEDEPAMRLKGGLPVRGRRITLRLRESSFGGSGQGGEAGMFLFASVLNEFLALYASVNSFHELRVIGVERKEEYQWPVRDGLLPLL